MKKSGSNVPKEIPEQELKRLPKENSALMSKVKTRKEADKAKIKDLRKVVEYKG